MEEKRRQQYLKWLGIPIWYQRAGNENKPVVLNTLEATSMLVDSRRIDEIASLDWDDLQAKVASCTACDLCKTRTQTVFGVGNRQAALLIIGEAPGANEDRQGEPFVGRAGQLLNAMLQAIKLKREQIYIANILKCRPPNNRDPNSLEVQSCTPFLQRQITLLQPKLILALGRVAAQHLLNTNSTLGKLRNQRFYFGKQRIPLYVSYHPAYLLRSPHDKRKAYDDLLLVAKYLQK